MRFDLDEVVKDALYHYADYSDMSFAQLNDFIHYFEIDKEHLPVDHSVYRVVYPYQEDFEHFNFNFDTFFILVVDHRRLGRDVVVLNLDAYLEFLHEYVFTEDFISTNENSFDLILSNLFHMHLCGSALDFENLEYEFYKFHSEGGEKAFEENVRRSSYGALMDLIKKRCWGAGGFVFKKDGGRFIHLVDIYGKKDNAVIYKILFRPDSGHLDERVKIESKEPVFWWYL